MSAVTPMTAAEFLAWTAVGSDRWELIDGTTRAMAPANPRHGAIQAETARLIGNHLVEIRGDLLRRGSDNDWPDNPLLLGPEDDVVLDSIDFSAGLSAFYRTT